MQGLDIDAGGVVYHLRMEWIGNLVVSVVATLIVPWFRRFASWLTSWQTKRADRHAISSTFGLEQWVPPRRLCGMWIETLRMNPSVAAENDVMVATSLYIAHRQDCSLPDECHPPLVYLPGLLRERHEVVWKS